MKTLKYVLAFFIIFTAASTCFSQDKTIVFTDNSMLNVTHEQKNADDLSSKAIIKVGYKDFIATFGSTGKAAPPLDEKTLKKLSGKFKLLAQQIKNTRSAYEVSQENTQFYFAAFNTVNYDNFRKCGAQTPCRIKCQAVVITITDRSKQENILIIKSMRKIK